MSPETIKQLWALLGVTATAVLGWIGYALKVRTDMKKEEIDRGRKASESERVEREKLRKELEDKLNKISSLSESQRVICENQARIEDSLNKIVNLSLSQEERLSAISEGLLIALDSCLTQDRILLENGLMTGDLSKKYQDIEDFEKKLRANVLAPKKETLERL